jgi:hypothetical protein
MSAGSEVASAVRTRPAARSLPQAGSRHRAASVARRFAGELRSAATRRRCRCRGRGRMGRGADLPPSTGACAPRQRKFGRARAEPPHGSPRRRFTFAACKSAGESTRPMTSMTRFDARDLRPDLIGVALQALVRAAAHIELTRRASPAPRELCSWIHSRPFPSGARESSIVSGCPTTTVASAGKRPRSASFTARETPSRPGVRWTIAVPVSLSSPSQRGGSESAKWICISHRP